jgi:DNA-directed RNA polymerase subunit RPC12/RpoP
MARAMNWSKARQRDFMHRERTAALDEMYWRGDWDRHRQANPGGRVAGVRCQSCGHRGYARVPTGVKEPHFRCGKCGSRLVKWRV